MTIDPDLVRNAWAALAPSGRPGPDWLTAGELARIWNVNRRTACDRLNVLLRDGKVERREGQNGGHAVVFYRTISTNRSPHASPPPRPSSHPRPQSARPPARRESRTSPCG